MGGRGEEGGKEKRRWTGAKTPLWAAPSSIAYPVPPLAPLTAGRFFGLFSLRSLVGKAERGSPHEYERVGVASLGLVSLSMAVISATWGKRPGPDWERARYPVYAWLPLPVRVRCAGVAGLLR